MFGWLRELSEIIQNNRQIRLRLEEERKERDSLCNSCEVLKVELSKERREKEMLLQHVLTQKNSETTSYSDSDPREPMPLISKRHIPWRVKQQELEAQDRAEAARIMTEFKDKVKANTGEIEKSIGLK